MKKRISQGSAIIMLIAALSSHQIYSQTSIEAEGTITENTRWTADTVRVTGDLVIADNVKLEIDPGTRVEVVGAYRIEVEGTLDAVGVPGDTIVFTCHPDSTASGWHGIYIYDNNGYMMDNDSTRLVCCKFEYGKARDGLSASAVTIREYSRISIRNSVFRHNQSSAIYCKDNSNIEISGNHFTQNDWAINCSNSDAVITYNRFVHSGGTVAAQNSSNAVISNNFFGDNEFTIKSYSSNPIITGNVICNNYWGMEMFSSEAIIANNTICNNYRGIYFSGEVKPLVVNNIFHGITNYRIFLQDEGTQPDFYYNNLQEGFSGGITHTGAFENNVNVMPEFVSPSADAGRANYDPSADWSLKVISELINAGSPDTEGLKLMSSDYDGNPRTAYTRVDIGALEYHMESIEACGSTNGNLHWYADTVRITCDYLVDDNYGRLFIYPGTVIEFQDFYKLDIKGTIYAIGTEDEKILFTVIDRDSAGFSNPGITAGGWAGMIFNNSNGPGGSDGAMSDNDSSILRHCIFEYKKKYAGPGATYAGAVILQSFSNIEIDHCEFRSNYGGIKVENSVLALDSCSFHNSSGAAITMGGSNTRYAISNCNFYNNIATQFSGGAISGQSVRGDITGCIFANNKAQSGGAIRILDGEGGSFVNNLFCNNHGVYGGGIYLKESPGFLIVNNTFANNRGQGVYLYKTSAEIYNSIFWGNYPEQIRLYNLKSQPDIYNTLIQDGLNGLVGEDYLGFSEYILDADPQFADPTAGYGLDYDGREADWSLLDISPGINYGRMSIPDLVLPDTDLPGNPRIHDAGIDLGAFENHSGGPQITVQPKNEIKCVGDSLQLSVQTREASFFQWQKDGVNIPGATSGELKINPVAASDEGNYQCLVSNSYDSVESDNAFVSVRIPPEILAEPGDQWLDVSKNTRIGVFAQGSNLMYHWTKNDTLIPGAITPELIVSNPGPDTEGSYTCIVENTCGSDTTNDLNLWLAPQLCMVTVSPTSGHNLVVWEKDTKAPVLAYNIYRESIAAGIYDLLATIPFDELSVFVDTTADPTSQAYLYKITALDTAESETGIDLCSPHKTIHLLVTTNPELNTTQLAWDKYYGFGYQTYTIYRSSTGVNFDPVHSLSASLNSWTDPDPATGDLFYRIAVEKPEPCVPEGGGKKAGTGPYQHALSNMDDNKLKAGENPPDSIYLNNSSIDENRLPGSLVGRLVTIDPDSTDSYTYHLVSGDGDADNESFTLIGDLLLSAMTFDYETKSTYSVRIRTTDNASYYLERSFVISINDTVESSDTTGAGSPPYSLTLDNKTIAENNHFGDPIGVFETADPDSLDVHSYQLVSGPGDDDNIMFMITGFVLRAGYTFDFEQKYSYSIRVRSTDLGGNRIEKVFYISITDVDETVGIQGTNAGNLSARPNPFTHTSTIVFPNPAADPYRMILTGPGGKVFRIKNNIRSSEFVLRREGLEKGLYFLELRGPQTYRLKLLVE